MRRESASIFTASIHFYLCHRKVAWGGGKSNGPTTANSGFKVQFHHTRDCVTVGNLLNLSGPHFPFLNNEWVGLKISSIAKILIFYMVTHSTRFPLWPELVCDFLTHFPLDLLIVKTKYEQEAIPFCHSQQIALPQEELWRSGHPLQYLNSKAMVWSTCELAGCHPKGWKWL